MCVCMCVKVNPVINVCVVQNANSSCVTPCLFTAVIAVVSLLKNKAWNYDEKVGIGKQLTYRNNYNQLWNTQTTTKNVIITSLPGCYTRTLQCWHCFLRLRRTALFSNVTASLRRNSAKLNITQCHVINGSTCMCTYTYAYSTLQVSNVGWSHTQNHVWCHDDLVSHVKKKWKQEMLCSGRERHCCSSLWADTHMPLWPKI